MLFPEEDAPFLKTWIVKRIENTSDADSDVLADYVIALLKHDGDADSVRKLCEAEIPDFLTEEPKAFLDDVFQAIAYKTYRPGAPPPPLPPAPPKPFAPAEALSNAGSRKRTLQDMAEPDTTPGELEPAYAAGRFKQTRRGRRGRMDAEGSGGRQGFAPPGGLGLGMQPAFDLSNPVDMLLQMRAMGIPLPVMQDFGGLAYPSQAGRHQHQHQHQPRRKARCRDFDTKGYCSRGNTCTYDHGNDSIFVSPMQGLGEEYDPTNAALPLSHAAPMMNMNPFNPFGTDIGRGAPRPGRGAHHSKKSGARAPFSAEGPVTDRSKSTIVVENIPEESFSEDAVRGFFSQFGQILEISMQPYKHLAIVKFDSWAPANAAYRSPKVIFDNRFVKVFWYKGTEDDLPPPSNDATIHSRPHGPGDTEPPMPEIDLDEFYRKQEEAQKQHQEREAKRSQLDRQRQDLERQQQELLAKHREETERLKEKLGAASHQHHPQASATEKLRAQLAELEREAKILGIDPDAADEAGAFLGGVLRGGGGGFRGRGARGGRGGLFGSSRGRGSFRGQGGRHAAYAQYSIDNRPKRLAISGVDFTSADKDEQLRHFLLNLGEFEAVEPSPSVTHVSFQDRKTAEKFYHSLHGRELPGVPGKLELSWVHGHADGASSSPTTAGKRTAEAVEDAGVAGDAMAGMDDALDNEGEEPERQVDMDYDVAGDEGWGE